MFYFSDLLVVYGGNFEYVIVEEDKEEQGWEEVNVGEDQYEEWVKYSKEGIGVVVGGLLEYGDFKWEEVNEVR